MQKHVLASLYLTLHGMPNRSIISVLYHVDTGSAEGVAESAASPQSSSFSEETSITTSNVEASTSQSAPPGDSQPIDDRPGSDLRAPYHPDVGVRPCQKYASIPWPSEMSTHCCWTVWASSRWWRSLLQDLISALPPMDNLFTLRLQIVQRWQCGNQILQ